MVNEVFCKLICHSCCVIMEQCVLGIEAEFRQDDETDAAAVGTADVLPMVRPG